MQTFLPYPDFEDSSKCLDYRRLGKQRVEAKQILNTLKYGSRWINHPAVKMWKGYESALKIYMNTIILEWIYRGYNNNMEFATIEDNVVVVYPFWLGNKEFHSSHRSNLLRKNKDFYGQYNWGEPDNIPYVWPV